MELSNMTFIESQNRNLEDLSIVLLTVTGSIGSYTIVIVKDAFPNLNFTGFHISILQDHFNTN